MVGSHPVGGDHQIEGVPIAVLEDASTSIATCSIDLSVIELWMRSASMRLAAPEAPVPNPW